MIQQQSNKVLQQSNKVLQQSNKVLQQSVDEKEETATVVSSEPDSDIYVWQFKYVRELKGRFQQIILNKIRHENVHHPRTNKNGFHAGRTTVGKIVMLRRSMGGIRTQTFLQS